MTTAMPPVHYVETNGIRMAVYEAGEATALPPIVFCHGFPEIAFSWRHQLRDLPAVGLHVLAPDQRGYGLTDRPADVESYDLAHLTADLIGLLDARGIGKAVFCGHDWGGIVVWDIARRYPDRVAGVIGLNTPHRARLPVDLVTAYTARYGPEHYVVHFQQPKLADELFASDVDKTMRYFLRRSPTREASTAAFSGERPKDGGSAFALQKGLVKFDPAKDELQFLDADELAFFVESFERSGFTGGINWYRNFRRNWERSADMTDRIEQPVLMITAENDAVLPPSLSEGMEDTIPNLSRHNVLGSGHWTQQEKPDEVSRVIADWMFKTFG
jgi:pimeloyl-ACP methyl ester carboxylesterase